MSRKTHCCDSCGRDTASVSGVCDDCDRGLPDREDEPTYARVASEARNARQEWWVNEDDYHGRTIRDDL